MIYFKVRKGEKMFTVLFTSIGRRVELIKAFKESYETHGVKSKVFGVDTAPSLAPASYFVDRCFKVPKAKEEGYVDSLLAICEAEKVDLLIPLFEPEFLLLDARRFEFARINTCLLLSERRVIETCSDKFKTYQFFINNGIKTPYTWLQEALPEMIRYPLFIKPRTGMGSQGAKKVESSEELQFILQHEIDFLIQEHIPGKEYTLDILADLEGQVLSVVPRERLEVRAGEVSKSRTLYRLDLIEQGKRIVEQLGAIGPVTVQCIDNGKELNWIEINPRFGGGVPLSIRAGVDYPYLLYQMVNMQDVKPLLGKYNHNLTMLRYDQAVYF